MNKIIEMIDKPDSSRGKILMCLALNGKCNTETINKETGITRRLITSHLYEMATSTAYIEISREKIKGRAYYELVDMKCKMSEARSFNIPRAVNEKPSDIPFNTWRKVFGLMDSCCG